MSQCISVNATARSVIKREELKFYFTLAREEEGGGQLVRRSIRRLGEEVHEAAVAVCDNNLVKYY